MSNTIDKVTDSAKTAANRAATGTKRFFGKVAKMAFFSAFIGTPAIFFWGQFTYSFIDDEKKSIVHEVMFTDKSDPLISAHATLNELLEDPTTVKQGGIQSPGSAALSGPDLEDKGNETMPKVMDSAGTEESKELAESNDEGAAAAEQKSEEGANTAEVADSSQAELAKTLNEIIPVVPADIPPAVISDVRRVSKDEVLEFVMDNIVRRDIQRTGSSISTTGQYLWIGTSTGLFTLLFFLYIRRIYRTVKLGKSSKSANDGANIANKSNAA